MPRARSDTTRFASSSSSPASRPIERCRRRRRRGRKALPGPLDPGRRGGWRCEKRAAGGLGVAGGPSRGCSRPDVVAAETGIEGLARAAYFPSLILVIAFRLWGGVHLFRGGPPSGQPRALQDTNGRVSALFGSWIISRIAAERFTSPPGLAEASTTARASGRCNRNPRHTFPLPAHAVSR